MPQRGRLKPDDEQRVRENIIKLKENIDGQLFLDLFFQKKIITQDERLQIKALPTRLKRADAFLDRLLDSGPGDAYGCFIEILRQHYEAIANTVQQGMVGSSYYSWFENSNNFSSVRRDHKLKAADISQLAECFQVNWPVIFLRLQFSSCLIEQEYVRNPQDKRAVIVNLMKKRDITLKTLVETLRKVEDDHSAIFDWKTLEKFVAKLPL
uniref:CARD domain-containing protein n=1 Tax=Biomphalaria glabrata TaxID=6526 RepID=A0A2C9KSP3_BIOGL